MWTAFGHVRGPYFARGQGMGGGLNLRGSGSGLLFSLRGQCITLQVTRVVAFINQALQFASLGLSVWNASSGGASNGQANVFTLIHALEHIGGFSSRCRT